MKKSNNVAIIIVVAVLILTVAGVILYFTVFHKPNTSGGTTPGSNKKWHYYKDHLPASKELIKNKHNVDNEDKITTPTSMYALPKCDEHHCQLDKGCIFNGIKNTCICKKGYQNDHFLSKRCGICAPNYGPEWPVCDTLNA